jgi:hypothetical protein
MDANGGALIMSSLMKWWQKTLMHMLSQNPTQHATGAMNSYYEPHATSYNFENFSL